MSFIRPRWLEDILQPTPAGSPRIRSLKGFTPEQVPVLQDPLYADDPTYWILSSNLAAVALNLGHIGVQTPNDDNIVCIVDDLFVSTAVAEDVSVDVTLGGDVLVALATDTQVTKRNRREMARSTSTERAGLLRIADNANAFTGIQIATASIVVRGYVQIPLGFRLYGSEQLWVRNTTANTQIRAYMRGRVTSKGPR